MTAPTEQTDPGDRKVSERAKVATAWVFVLAGAAFASWASRIPDVRHSLGLAPGQLGLLLLVGSCGSLVGLPLAGWVAARIGTRRTVLLGASLAMVGLTGAGVSAGPLHSFWLTAACLFVTLAGIGQWDVAMNIEGAQVEHRLGRHIMPKFHAAFSGGTVGTALLAAGLVAVGVPFALHFAVSALVLLGGVVLASRAFLPSEAPVSGAADETVGSSPARAWREPRTLLIGLVMLVAAFTEGTANDWISVAFVDGYHLPTWAGVLGFATFLTFMTIGRLVGAGMLDRWGRVPVLRAMLVGAGVGSLLVVFGTPLLAYLGAAIWGFGVSLGFPVGVSAASDEPRHAAARVSVVSTIAYGAFLAGPPALGFGDHWGVLRALGVVSALLVVALVALPALRPPTDSAD